MRNFKELTILLFGLVSNFSNDSEMGKAVKAIFQDGLNKSYFKTDPR
jgi:hypothetical protein